MLTRTPPLHTNSKPIKFSPKLPPELWNLIFLSATLSEKHPSIELRLVTKRALVLVCKSWQAIALPLLYQLVWIRDAPRARHFLRTLVDTATIDVDTPAGYGKWVHDLILPRGMGSQHWRGFHIADLLNRCPHVRAILKVADMNADFWDGIASSSSLTTPTLDSFISLRRIVWICSSNPGTIAVDARRLAKIMQHAPNLTFLHILNPGQRPFPLWFPPNNPSTKLTSLNYLTYGTPGPAAPLHLRQSDLPNLSCVSADLAALTARDPIDGDEDRSSLLAIFGKQLRAVNLLYSKSSISGDVVPDIHSIFRRCPNLNTLNFNAFPAVFPHDSGVLHPSLRVVVLQITGKEKIGDEELEQSLRTHIRTIMGDAFPALCRVKLDVTGRLAEQLYAVCRDLLKRFPKERVEGTVTIWES